jgi:hypothetical protein
MLGDRPAAEDVVQEAFCGLYRRVLIAVIPDGRIGVIKGDEFTPLNMPPVPSVIMYIGLGAQAGAW